MCVEAAKNSRSLLGCRIAIRLDYQWEDCLGDQSETYSWLFLLPFFNDLFKLDVIVAFSKGKIHNG